MSNYNLKAKHKVTGTIHDFTALDHVHSYSYILEEYNMTFTSKEFNELYEVIDNINLCINIGDRVKIINHSLYNGKYGTVRWIDSTGADVKFDNENHVVYFYNDELYEVIEDKSYDIIETGNDKMSIAYVVPKENLNTIEIDGFKTLEDRFDTKFTNPDTGLLNIGKYDHDRLLNWIKNEITC